MRLVFIRHGMTRGNSLRRYIGRTDEPLCGEGREQIKSRVYPPADIVICSPMRRCIETAKIIYPNQKPRIYDNLRECDFGDFEGKSYEELCGNPDYESWLKSGGALPVPNGESGEAFSRRCADAFLTAARDCANAKSAAFVVHGGTIMAIMEKYAVPQKGFYEYMQKNGRGYRADWDGEKIVIRGVIE